METINGQLLNALRGLVDCAGLTWLPGYKDELDTAMKQAHAAIANAEGKLTSEQFNNAYKRMFDAAPPNR